MMVSFESLTILAASLIIGRLCFVLEAMSSNTEELPTYEYPYPSPDGSIAAKDQGSGIHECVEITASTSCSCIIQENNRNVITITINNGDKLENCTIIVYTSTPNEDEKCSFNITIPNRESHHCKRNFDCSGNYGMSGLEKLHSCEEVEKFICNALSKKTCTMSPPALWHDACCVLVSTTDSPSISNVTETRSTSSSPTKSLTIVSSVLPTPSEQASVTVTTTTAAAKTSVNELSSKKASTGTPSSDRNIPGTQSPNAGDPSPFTETGAVFGTVIIGVSLIIVIAVVLIVILFRRYKRGNRVSIDNIETTTGERNPAYSLVQGTFSPVHDSTHPQATNIYSQAPSHQPITPPNSNDTVLVDNELYGHQPEQNFPTEAVPRLKANAAVDSSQQQSVYSLVQRTSTSDDSTFQPLHPTPSSSQKPSTKDNDRILVENDLYGYQQAPSSTYEMALPASGNESAGNEQTTSPTRYSLVRPVSTADDPVQPPATTDTCSAESSSAQKQPADGSDRLLVDNDLYNC